MFTTLIKALRPKQWAKNVFLFVGLVFDRKLTNLPAFLHIIAGFFIFSLLASVVYLINDIADIEADRKHPKKRFRPIAAGDLPVPVAWGAAIFILFLALPAAYLLSPSFAAIGVLYLLLNLSYSKWLKHVVLLDIIILASFYVIRVAAGVTLIDVERFSPWLYIFTTFLALLIGAGKRRAELGLLAEGENAHRRVLDGYTLQFLDQLTTLASGLTIITYGLYTFSAPNLPGSHTMMLTIPFIIYSIFRYQYLIQVKNTGGAPEDLILSDRPLQLAIVLYGFTVLLIFYIS
ncbi:MAG: decaprenyl-phosphate phosphoribosyltransferase [Anaerolineales bacterium]|nr:decaprenyl-phosphate phosphoribosyltransferase [Chloroflexota bacterium]MBL6981873.1 decaprenyl-phosphate phosphoribosyltransferase [Anaerolineales bacterium]